MSENEQEQPATLAEALLAFQADPPQFIKDQEAEVKGRSKAGKEFSYTYKYLSLQALLEGLRPRLTQLGLLWETMPGVHETGKPVLGYRLVHVASKETIGGEMPLVVGATMQDYGGALSFARRYALITVLNIAPDVDEDAQTKQRASGAKARKVSKPAVTKLVELAAKHGLLGGLQAAASYLHEDDVGPANTEEQALAAVAKLNVQEAEGLKAWIDNQVARKGEQS